jgi:hypothetical protein
MKEFLMADAISPKKRLNEIEQKNRFKLKHLLKKLIIKLNKSSCFY